MHSQGSILIVDDDDDVLYNMRSLLQPRFGKVVTEHNPHLIPRLLRMHEPDLILLNINFRQSGTMGSDGITWLSKILELYPDAFVVMMTGYSDVDLALKATEKGAIDFIEKPWRKEDLLASLNTIFTLKKATDKNRLLQQILGNISAIDPLQKILAEVNLPLHDKIMKAIEKVEKSPSPIIIIGENGTEKVAVARYIHHRIHQSNSIFLPIDLLNIPADELETVLWGFQKDRPPYSRAAAEGGIKMAQEGTLFLQHVEILSEAISQELTKQFLEDKAGASSINDAAPKLLFAATISAQQTADDIPFVRLLKEKMDAIIIEISPIKLRKNKSEIIKACFHFYASAFDKNEKQIESNALQKLALREWRGNTHELLQTIKYLVLNQDEEGQVTFSLAPTKASLPETLNLEALERNAIQLAMDRHNNNITRAAKDLGITRASLYRRMEKYGM